MNEQEAHQAKEHIRDQVEQAFRLADEVGATSEAEYCIAVVAAMHQGWDTATTAAMVEAVVDNQPIEVIDMLTANALTKWMGRLS